MGKYALLVKYKFKGTAHTSGYCSGNEGDEDVAGTTYTFEPYPHPAMAEEVVEFVKDPSVLNYREKDCRVEMGSGYCEAYVYYRVVWARKVNKRKDKGFLIRETERLLC